MRSRHIPLLVFVGTGLISCGSSSRFLHLSETGPDTSGIETSFTESPKPFVPASAEQARLREREMQQRLRSLELSGPESDADSLPEDVAYQAVPVRVMPLTEPPSSVTASTPSIPSSTARPDTESVGDEWEDSSPVVVIPREAPAVKDQAASSKTFSPAVDGQQETLPALGLLTFGILATLTLISSSSQKTADDLINPADLFELVATRSLHLYRAKEAMERALSSVGMLERQWLAAEIEDIQRRFTLAKKMFRQFGVKSLEDICRLLEEEISEPSYRRALA